MNEFKGRRVTHEYKQINLAPPSVVFPLLCPVREADWFPGWQYRMIHSVSGYAEAGCVFATPNSASQNDAGSQTIWIVTEHDPSAWRIAFAWVNVDRVAVQINISLTPNLQGTTDAHIRYTYTGLSDAGNREVESYTRDWFANKMQGWEKAINHYLTTGTILDGTA